MNDEVLPGFINSVFILVDYVELDDLKGIWTWVGCFREVATDDLNLNTALWPSTNKSAAAVQEKRC
jgi:hypothetical protein